jgi:acetyl-CoA carboxylase biotin carboxylase subunit
VIKRLLIANRGEIAVRIIRACREMGISPVVVYSTADRDSLHTRLADKAICIGSAPAAKSYLLQKNLIEAAIKTHCEALHPGVGFLSENAGFARAVTDAGLVFIGPSPETLALLGDKIAARETAERLGLPVTPGTKEAVSNIEEALEAVKTLNLPIIIKAAAGGGGKGMRIVNNADELEEALKIASREAESNFASGSVFIERYIENPRHVELQILASGAEKVAVLGERDCSVQKNHQKLIEESPSPAISDAMRKKMTALSLKLFSGLSYRGAGTIEFLVKDDSFYFMEVNARVQVEHPVSEMVCGVDIIREQILACTNNDMELAAGCAHTKGAAIECRINALSPGKVGGLEIPGGPGVRWDSFLYSGCTVPPYYDALVAKLIVHADNRPAAISRMLRALGELRIDGIKTNIEEQKQIISSPEFYSGEWSNK